MKRKKIALILAFVLFTAPALQAKAELVWETEQPTEHSTVKIEDVKNEENMDPAPDEKEELPSPEDLGEPLPEEEDEHLPPHVAPPETDLKETSDVFRKDFLFHEGDMFQLSELLSEPLSEGYAISTTPSLPDGILTTDHLGVHELEVLLTHADKEAQTHHLTLRVNGVPQLSATDVILEKGSIFDTTALKVEAVDPEDGNLTEQIYLIESPYQEGDQIVHENGAHFSVTVGVKDQDGKESRLETTVTVEETLATTALSTVKPLLRKTLTLSGTTRYQTAAAISSSLYETSDTVILTSSDSFPDALAGGPLAKKLGAPILITRADRLSESILTEIDRLGAKRIIILGGEAAVSSTVEKDLKSRKYETLRLFGSNRYQTSIKIAEQLKSGTEAILTNGMEFADAMAAGSYASIQELPILLSTSGKLQKEAKAFLEKGIQKVYVIGGDSAISPAVIAELKEMNITVERIAGDNRYLTALEVTKRYFPQTDMVLVANGLNFVDALTAVPYAAQHNLPILFSRQDRVSDAITSYVIDKEIQYFHYIGGPSAISENVKDSLQYPSLYDISYRMKTLEGTWSAVVKNGQTLSANDGKGFSHLEITPQGTKDLSLHYSVSTTKSGWLKVQSGQPSGKDGEPINGVVFSLRGKDAANYDVYYRIHLSKQGWTSWVRSDTPLLGSTGEVVTAIETRIIEGNALSSENSLSFPSTPPSQIYAYTKSAVRLRAGEGTSYAEIMMLPLRAQLKILSVNQKGDWAKVSYDKNGVTHIGYTSVAYIQMENQTTRTLLTMDGLVNGQKLPGKDMTLTGIAAYEKGIKEVNYYVNNIKIGTTTANLLTEKALQGGYRAPAPIGYSIQLPSSVWNPKSINTIKVELIGKDGHKEWDVRYLLGDISTQVTFEQYNGSFNYYLDQEYSRVNGKYPATYNGKPATREQIEQFMDPTLYVSQEGRQNMFLDLGYSASSFTITVEELNKVLDGKGVLHGMGEVFLKAGLDFNVNPYYLMVHSLLETGRGTSTLAKGQKLQVYHEKFGDLGSQLIPLSDADKEKTWYNVFGIGAYDGNANLWGGERAYHEGWDTVEKAIYGGSQWIAKNYLNRTPEPQNTTYKMRFNLYETMTHQYASDIGWSMKQSDILNREFNELGITFPRRLIIPVFSQIRP